MQDANQDTHTEVAVPVTNYVSRWFTNKEAEKFMESDEEWAQKNIIDNQPY